MKHILIGVVLLALAACGALRLEMQVLLPPTDTNVTLDDQCAEEIIEDNVAPPGGFGWVQADVRLENIDRETVNYSVKLACPSAEYAADMNVVDGDCWPGNELLPGEVVNVGLLFRVQTGEALASCALVPHAF